MKTELVTTLKRQATRIIEDLRTEREPILLAKAGVLNGKKATSNKLAFDWVCAQSPNVTWVREACWVEDGRFFTSSGISAGIDMSLGLIQHIFGRDISLQIAHSAEYTCQEDKSVDPFA